MSIMQIVLKTDTSSWAKWTVVPAESGQGALVQIRQQFLGKTIGIQKCRHQFALRGSPTAFIPGSANILLISNLDVGEVHWFVTEKNSSIVPAGRYDTIIFAFSVSWIKVNLLKAKSEISIIIYAISSFQWKLMLQYLY